MKKQLNDMIIVENELIIDFASHQLWNKDNPDNSIELSATPYEVLVCLWENKNTVVDNDFFLKNVWDNDKYEYYSNVVKDNISKIRRIISNLCSDDLATRFIVTQKGSGYIILERELNIEIMEAKDKNSEYPEENNPQPELTQNIYGGLVINNNGNMNYLEHVDTVNINN